MTSQQQSESLIVVGLGEALFDHFSPDQVVLGGAPVNLAVHAHNLLQTIGQGVVASSVGDDELGQRLRGELTKRGITDQYVTVSKDIPTGTVEVTIAQDGSPSYEIRENVAWDHLEYSDSWQRLAYRCSAVCFGTLAQRSTTSRRTIRQFLEDSPQALHVLDLNLRQHYFTPALIDESLQMANVLKLNEEELAIIGNGQYGVDSSGVIAVNRLISRYNLQLVAVTRGARGTTIFAAGEFYEAEIPTYPPVTNADTVGAGDACCAAIIVGLLQGLPPEKIVELANHAGAYVASQAGATPMLPPEIWGRVA